MKHVQLQEQLNALCSALCSLQIRGAHDTPDAHQLVMQIEQLLGQFSPILDVTAAVAALAVRTKLLNPQQTIETVSQVREESIGNDKRPKTSRRKAS